MIIVAIFIFVFIIFCFAFLYFSRINPGDVTIFLTADYSLVFPVAIILLGAVLVGLLLGNGVHILSLVSHSFSHWRRDRKEKKIQEVGSIYREGVGRLLSGDIKKAHSLLQRALDKDPVRIEAYIAMASVLMQEGKSEEAINLLLKAKNIDPRSLEVLFKLATTYEEIGRTEAATEAYQGIISLEKDNRKAMRCLRELYIANGQWTEALDLQKQVLKVGPGSNRMAEEKEKLLSLRYEVARHNLEANEIDRAKSDLKELIKEDPDFVPARVSLGDAYLEQERVEDAVKVWTDGYLALGKSVFLSRLEDYYLEAEDPSTLLGIYKSILDQRDSDMVLRLFYGKLCLRLEMVDEALEQLFAVESTGVETPQLHLLLAEAHRRRNRVDESVEQYKKALGVDGRLRINYVCDTCSSIAEEWQSRCSGCGSWGSFSVAGRQQIINAPTPVDVRPIHHGERE
jgi:lipopolysaccharide biosynthesis regulator YciM